MLVVGLTGGMGAGKSSVARSFAERGARVIDADAIAREVVEPGTPALAAIAERFGAAVLRDDGTLDRARVAAIVFADDEALADLEAITHPAIRRAIAERMAALAADEEATGGRHVVVLDHPLLVETGLAADVDVVVVVEAPLEVRLDRLVEGRGVDRDDARARIALQASDAERRAVADHVVVNDGSLAALDRAVSRVWAAVTRARRDSSGPDRGGRDAAGGGDGADARGRPGRADSLADDLDENAPEPRRG